MSGDTTGSRQPVTKAGNCHRIALAVQELQPATRWFQEVLGATTMPVVHEVGEGGIDLANDGALLTILWLQSVPIVLLSSTEPGGNVGRFLAANGPSVQSLAWEIADMWRTENLLRADGLRIVGTDIPGRHFFVHPRDTHGVLLEYTDDVLAGDPRRGAPAPAGQGTLPVRAVAWVTVVVDDLSATVDCLRYLFDASDAPEFDIDSEQARGVALRIGDMIVRLVTPTSDAGIYARRPGTGNNRYHSMALAVDDLAGLPDRLEALGIGIDRTEAGSVWTARADTLGVQLEFVEASVLANP